MEEKKNSKNGLIIFLILIILILIGLLVYFVFIKKDEPSKPIDPNNNTNNVNNNVSNDEKNYPGLKLDDTTNYTNGFYVYYNKSGDEFCYYDDITKCGTDKVFIKTETDNIKKYNEFEDKYVFYRDNDKVKVYNNETKKSYIVNIPSNYFGYNFSVDNLTKDFVGIMYFETSESFASYYSVELDKKIYDKEYKELYFLTKDYIMGNQYECSGYNCRQTVVNLLSAKENKKYLSYELKKKSSGFYEENMRYTIIENSKEKYIALTTFIDADIYVELYNKDFKKLASDIGEYSVSIGEDGSLYIEKNGIISKYNSNGDVLKKSQKYDVLQLLGDYIVSIKDNKLVLITIDGDIKEITSFDKSKNEYSLYKSKVIGNKIVLGVKDKDVKLDDVWSYCEKSNKCDDVTKEDLQQYYQFGYEYYFDIETNKVSNVFTYMQ